MKTTLLATSAAAAFVCSYFFNLAMENSEQYLAVVAVIFMDGFFGVIAGTKREGFKTYKAVRILKTLVAWIITLTALIMVEAGFKGTSWLSETILIPLIVFQVISALKNAEQAGFIKNEALTAILDKIDKHKEFITYIKSMGKKLFPYIIALSALAVSASAAFYSVSGIMKLFAGASLAVGIMAGSLEVAKLVIASLLYQYWTELNKFLRTYLTIAAFVLILITSAGIYGFLSSAYQETANRAGIVDQKILALETKKKLYEGTREGIYKEKESLSGLKESLSKGSTTQFTDRKGNLVVRSNNASIKQIESASKSDEKLSGKLDAVNDSIFSLENKILEVKTSSTVSSELGPLKYLSGLTGQPMDKIINWFLLVIIFVFDPLAIALVIAANFAFGRKEQQELTEEDKEWLEAPLVEEEWDEDHAMDQVLNEIVEDIPEEEWRIEDEDKEPYEVYTGPKEEIIPLQTQIESIQNDKHLSEWGKRSKIEEATNRFKKESLGKVY
jgi:hypothetical protein